MKIPKIKATGDRVAIFFLVAGIAVLAGSVFFSSPSVSDQLVSGIAEDISDKIIDGLENMGNMDFDIPDQSSSFLTDTLKISPQS